jgi:Domain of unknown function (DUF4159)
MSDPNLLGRRALTAGLALLAFTPGRAAAFGDAGAFRARLLAAGKGRSDDARAAGTSRWASELVRRTSAPGREEREIVAADRPALFREPFAVWSGAEDVGALSMSEVSGLERFLRLGGTLVVDDAEPTAGEFGRSARRELARALPESPPVRLESSHVLFKTFYLLDRPVGRVLGPTHIDAIVRGRNAVVLFLAHDLLGALARRGEGWAFGVEPGGPEQREHAIRLAVNIAMYVLCSDYKDDVVHAPFLLQRRGRAR